ncbi:MAG: phage holin family protein [Sandaracinaceae bacterium]|nr:phage holin family protein [Sandaracinaceae bacterium]
MTKFLVHWSTVAIGLWVAAKLIPGIAIHSLTALAVAALVLGLINASVRPVLHFLTFPITILTLGIFYLVVNGIAFGLAAFLVPGFGVSGLVPAILGALVVSVLSWFIGLFTGANQDEESRTSATRAKRDR